MNSLSPKSAEENSKKRIEEFVKSHEAWIQKCKNAYSESVKNEVTNPRQIGKLKREAHTYFSEKIDYYSKLMGLKYNKMTVTSAKTRYGSCSYKGNIAFSYRLMFSPEAVREYVVVHELAHLLELNHSSAFYDIVRKYMPDYKERKKMLK